MTKTVQETEELQQALRDTELSKAEYIRVQAVMFRKQKKTRHEVAGMVGKSIHAIEDWMNRYKRGGVIGLKTVKRKTPPNFKLTMKQREKLVRYLRGKPKERGIGDEAYWTMQAVKQLVRKETGVVYKSINSYRRLLVEAGMSYQKVEFVDKHQNQERHDEFKKQFETKVKGGRMSMWW